MAKKKAVKSKKKTTVSLMLSIPVMAFYDRVAARAGITTEQLMVALLAIEYERDKEKK